MAASIPEPTRPLMGADYGLSAKPDGMLAWSWVEQQLTKSRNYWISTTRTNGKPHAAPVWGIWMDGSLIFGIGKTSVKGRNLAHNPAVNIHLESGDEVVILEGKTAIVTDQAILTPFYKLYAEKYDFDPSQNSDDSAIYYLLKPDVVLAWLEHDFPNTATRWDFRAVR